MNSQILEKVEKSGVCGIKKAELKKLFGTDCETSLDELAKEDKVIVDNKGVAHYVWSKDNYLSHVSQNDPKFKILSRLVTNLENKISQMQSAQIPQNTVDFQIHFDKCISEHSASLGWTPLSEIRAKVCASLDITPEKFYSLVSTLIEQNQSKYEISTGGQEGIHVRGMLHGYIRKL
ncbi:hypothetical protein [Candidatus Nitrosotenuis cloacae]|uniref:Uncharacterized protein n=1 Tax=Candidatus Nitrosotenuis cloacae TaxID=1603555 RepID=A0A3G1B3Y9_9ARCH|nr:hypothetical protein [Candidatus Nitrosotenuis cloacae]AJZ75633.1 hypothetical protein SU86_003790 [Candidatus Nitrosotenuis cloacae]